MVCCDTLTVKGVATPVEISYTNQSNWTLQRMAGPGEFDGLLSGAVASAADFQFASSVATLSAGARPTIANEKEQARRRASHPFLLRTRPKFRRRGAGSFSAR
jgi:hypothetical protein